MQPLGLESSPVGPYSSLGALTPGPSTPQLQSFLECQGLAFPCSATAKNHFRCAADSGPLVVSLAVAATRGPLPPNLGCVHRILASVANQCACSGHLRVRSPALRGHTRFSEDVFLFPSCLRRGV